MGTVCAAWGGMFGRLKERLLLNIELMSELDQLAEHDRRVELADKGGKCGNYSRGFVFFV